MEVYKISMIIPVYNAEQYLKKCVDSVRAQTYGNLEIMLVDDGSTDSSGELCDAYAEKDERIRVVHKENGGLVSAWKAGVKECSGEYVSFLDSDDWINQEMLSEMSAYLTGNDREMVISDYIIERDGGSQEYVWQKLAPGEYGRKEIEEKIFPCLLGQEERYITISRCMKLISKRLISENGNYTDPAIIVGEDTTIMLPVLLDCQRIVAMDHKAYYHYLYVKESMVHKYNEKLTENIRKLIQTTDRILKDKFTGDKLEEQKKHLDQESILWYFLVLKNEARGNPSGYRRNILKLCRSEEIRDLVKRTEITVNQPANKLLYLVMKHPGEVTVRLLRLAMIWYYRS
ncbi:glycosyltransferase family 2 protein [Suilimivivens sp.]|uniref:glycosyltransferase family 2 protein n=1 Tax=Suilimivivens sp. TaxID=2981669 RepID=UPI003076D83A